MRFAMLDIESTGLEASFGRLVCCCFKFTDEDFVHTIKIRRVRDEKKALEKIEKLYYAADVICTWNGKLFDVPFINGRRMFHGLPPLTPIKHLDLMYQARKLRLRGSRLENVCKDLKSKVTKYDVPAWRWTLAAEGDTESINEIATHCEFDVLITEEMFHRLRPLVSCISR